MTDSFEKLLPVSSTPEAAMSIHDNPPTFSRRQWLMIRAMEAGGGPFLSVEAVASWAIENPDVDMNERHTWIEWEQLANELAS